MITTIDVAGRIVIPKALRDQVGLTTGEVEVSADGTGVTIRPIAQSGAVDKRGRLVIPAGDDEAMIDDDLVRSLRLGDQR